MARDIATSRSISSSRGAASGRSIANGRSLVSASAPGAAATGYLEFAANPVDGDTLPALNGFSTIVFKDSPGAFPEIQISGHGDLWETLLNLATALESFKGDPGNEALNVADYATDAEAGQPPPLRLLIVYKTTGTAGNSFTLGASTSNITRSGPTLTGGS